MFLFRLFWGQLISKGNETLNWILTSFDISILTAENKNL